MFLHHVLRHYLESGQIREAVQLATNYQHLVFFAHGLEILLHTVVESEATAEADESGTSNAASKTLPAVIEFLDHFDVALDVVVGCARKTEVTRWRRLFEIVGNPKSLFEVRLAYCPIYILINDTFGSAMPQFRSAQDSGVLFACAAQSRATRGK